MKQLFIPWVKYMYSICKDAWDLPIPFTDEHQQSHT